MPLGRKICVVQRSHRVNLGQDAHINDQTIIPRSEHTVSRANISEHALKVLYRLRKSGYQAYLVGGGVRDLLLGLEPKDFDVATNATPDEVRAVFRNCRLIGRRFRLAHIVFGRDVIEVATFRGQGSDAVDDDQKSDESGRLLRDNVYGTLAEDAVRRDFTINALYYSIDDFSLIDYTQGLEDLRQGVIRIIGDAELRYREDPVRMLRAVRFAAKTGFRLEKETEAKVFELGHLLKDIPAARLFDEVLKLFMSGRAHDTFEALRHYRLFEHLFPMTEEALTHELDGFPLQMLVQALKNTDQRIAEGKPVTPAFLFGVLLWEPVRLRWEALCEQGDLAEVPALAAAARSVVSEQVQHISLPRRFSTPMQEIWLMQPRLRKRGGKRAFSLVESVRFRAAYDFLLLRAGAGEEDQSLADWWTLFQEVDLVERKNMTRAVGAPPRGRRKRRAPKKSS